MDQLLIKRLLSVDRQDFFSYIPVKELLLMRILELINAAINFCTMRQFCSVYKYADSNLIKIQMKGLLSIG